MKAVIRMGYGEYVIDMEDAFSFLKIFENAERYKEKWKRKEDGGTTHHVYSEHEESSGVTHIKFISDDLYRIAKLAGKPAE